MSMNRAFPILACALLSGGIVASDAHAQLTTAEIVREVVPAIEGVPAGIEGALIYEEKRNRTDFSIVVEGLPIGAYAVFIDNDFKGFLSSFRSNGFETFAELEFSTRQRGDRLLLNFEPRDALVEIRSLSDNDRLYASGRLPVAVDVTENDPAGFDRIRVREDFASLDGPAASGRIDIRSNKRKTDLRVRVKNLAPGNYELRADGMPIGEIISLGRGTGQLRYSTRPAELPALVANVGNAQNPGGDLLPIGMAMSDPSSAGFDQDASARIMFENKPDYAELDIDMNNVPVGQYVVLVEVTPGQYEEIGNFQVKALEGEETEEGEEGDALGDELSPAPRQGVGEDNNGVQTFGGIVLTNTGFGENGEELDDNNNDIERLFFDDQGLPLLIVDGEDRVWFRGTFPDSGFELPLIDSP